MLHVSHVGLVVYSDMDILLPFIKHGLEKKNSYNKLKKYANAFLKEKK